MGGYRLHSSGSEQGQVARSCAYDNQPSRYIKCSEFLYKLRNH